MQRRVLGVVVVMAVVGAVAGYAVAELDQPAPLSFSTPAPVPAVDPTAPIIPPIVITDDPPDAALSPALDYRRERLPTGGVRPLTVDIPRDWVRNPAPPATSTDFTWTTAARTRNTFNLRVNLLCCNQAPLIYLNGRALALDIATGIQRLQIEQQTSSDASADLVATYVDSGNYERVTVERWVVLDGSGTYATVAATGRLEDREGLVALLDHVSASLRIPS